MYAILLAKLHGAEVTGVDNAEKQEFMRSLGADHVVDYMREDFTKSGRNYDLILDLPAHSRALLTQIAAAGADADQAARFAPRGSPPNRAGQS